jgi:hypothetical protein
MRHVRLAIAMGALVLTGGCASHVIRSAASADTGNAGQPFSHRSTSFAGAKGLSTEGTGLVTRDTCRTGELAAVEVKRDVGQTIVTLLTLGIVSPATILYHCEKPKPPPPPCDCPAQREEL